MDKAVEKDLEGNTCNPVPQRKRQAYASGWNKWEKGKSCGSRTWALAPGCSYKSEIMNLGYKTLPSACAVKASRKV